MKKFFPQSFSIYLSIFVLVLFSFGPRFAFAAGEIEISTCQELQDISDDLTADYILVNDIDCNADTHEGGDLYNGGAGFTPLGDANPEELHFTGTLDGQGYVVSNLYMNNVEFDRVSLIPYNGGTIENIGLKDVDITGNSIVAALVGSNYGTIVNAFSTGTVVGTTSVGGLVGQNPSAFATISRSYSSVNITSDGNYSGGLVASLTAGTVSDCYATGDVDGVNNVGGLTGYNLGTVQRSYATGAVSGDANVGGLVGLNSIFFFELTEGTVTDSFYDSDTTGQADEDKGTGKNTAAMKAVATYTETDTVGLDAAWDFVDNPNDDVGNNDYWDIDADFNSGYPVLAWQDLTLPTVTNISSDKADGSYTVGEIIDIDVTFSEVVSSAGNVIVTLETGDTDRICTFTVSYADSGTCNYTVQAGDSSSDLTVKLVTGTVLDPSGNLLASFIPNVNLDENKAIVIDTVAPTGGLSSSVAANSTVSSAVSFSVTFSEDVANFAAGDIAVTNGVVGSFAVQTANSVFTFVVTPSSGGGVSVSIAAGALTDLAGNENSAVTAYNFNYSSGGAVFINRSTKPAKTVEVVAVPFLDIEGHFAQEAIERLFQLGVVKGRSTSAYEPDYPLTRVEVAKVAISIFKHPLTNDLSVLDQFSDLEPDEWYVRTLATAVEDGLMHGYVDGTMRPNAFVTRAEALQILLLASELDLGDFKNENLPFGDVEDDAWYHDFIAFAYVSGIVHGKSTDFFDPNTFITRGEMAVIAVGILDF